MCYNRVLFFIILLKFTSRNCCRYESGDRLSPEHEKAILERLLPYHPQYEKKIGCGIDYITVGLHPEFENSRCLFIVRKDGERVDFSFWKCVKGLIRQKYPMYADSFILRHFRRRQDYWSRWPHDCFSVIFLWYWFCPHGFNILRFCICWNPCGVFRSKRKDHLQMKFWRSIQFVAYCYT